MKEGRQHFGVVCIKDDVYVFGGRDNFYGYLIRSIEKYSHVTKTWKRVADMYDDRDSFCTCSFMGNVIVMAGMIDRFCNWFLHRVQYKKL